MFHDLRFYSTYSSRSRWCEFTTLKLKVYASESVNFIENPIIFIVHGDIAIDTVEEIIDHIEAKYPDDYAQINDPTLNESVDKLTRNFFSKFCFYIKSVSKDASALIAELNRLDDLLKGTTTR